MLTFVLRCHGAEEWHYPAGNSNVTLCGLRLAVPLQHEDWRPLLSGVALPGPLCQECERRQAAETEREAARVD